MAGPAGAPERGGFVRTDGTLVESENQSDTPLEGISFALTPELLAILPDVVATWHTHPGASANLSVGDSDTFTSWPNLAHAIVGETETRWYAVKHGAVINA